MKQFTQFSVSVHDYLLSLITVLGVVIIYNLKKKILRLTGKPLNVFFFVAFMHNIVNIAQEELLDHWYWNCNILLTIYFAIFVILQCDELIYDSITSTKPMKYLKNYFFFSNLYKIFNRIDNFPESILCCGFQTIFIEIGVQSVFISRLLFCRNTIRFIGDVGYYLVAVSRYIFCI